MSSPLLTREHEATLKLMGFTPQHIAGQNGVNYFYHHTWDDDSGADVCVVQMWSGITQRNFVAVYIEYRTPVNMERPRHRRRDFVPSQRPDAITKAVKYAIDLKEYLTNANALPPS